MPGVNLPRKWEHLYDELRRDVAALKKANPLRNASITGGQGLSIRGLGRLLIQAGSFLVQDEVEHNVLYAGGFEGAGYGVAMYRRTGSPAMYFSGPTGADQTLRFYDRNGGLLLSEDASGDGLSRPFLPIPFYSTVYTDWPGTMSATYATIAAASGYRQNKRVYVTVRHSSDTAGTTGQVILLANGVQVGSAISVAFAIGEALIGPFDMPGSAEATYSLTLQARRTAGVGTVHAMVSGAGGTPA